MKLTAAWVLALGMMMGTTAPAFADDNALPQKVAPQEELTEEMLTEILAEVRTKVDVRFNVAKCPKGVYSKFEEAVNYKTIMPAGNEGDEVSTRAATLTMAEFGLTRMVDYVARHIKKEESAAFGIFCKGVAANSQALLIAKKDYNKAYNSEVAEQARLEKEKAQRDFFEKLWEKEQKKQGLDRYGMPLTPGPNPD